MIICTFDISRYHHWTRSSRRQQTRPTARSIADVTQARRRRYDIVGAVVHIRWRDDRIWFGHLFRLVDDTACILLGPLAGGFVVFLPVVDVLLGDVSHQRIVRITVAHQRTDRQQDLAHVQDGRPVVLNDVPHSITLSGRVHWLLFYILWHFCLSYRRDGVCYFCSRGNVNCFPV